jgi:hypothetical protein
LTDSTKSFKLLSMPKVLWESRRSSLDDTDSTVAVVALDGAVFTMCDHDHDGTIAVDNH